jgi:hypothetical protein
MTLSRENPSGLAKDLHLPQNSDAIHGQGNFTRSSTSVNLQVINPACHLKKEISSGVEMNWVHIQLKLSGRLDHRIRAGLREVCAREGNGRNAETNIAICLSPQNHFAA